MVTVDVYAQRQTSVGHACLITVKAREGIVDITCLVAMVGDEKLRTDCSKDTRSRKLLVNYTIAAALNTAINRFIGRPMRVKECDGYD